MLYKQNLYKHRICMTHLHNLVAHRGYGTHGYYFKVNNSDARFKSTTIQIDDQNKNTTTQIRKYVLA